MPHDRAHPAAAPAANASLAAAPASVPTLAIVGLALAAGASGLSLRLADALLPRLSREFNISLGEASLVITVFAVAYGVAQALFGPLGDRFGKYRVIAWACAASALTSLGCALAPGHHSLPLARLLAGATAAAVIPLAMAWIGDVVPYERRQPVLACFLIGQITGFALGVWAGGYTAEHLPWRTPFFALALLFALIAVGCGGCAAACHRRRCSRRAAPVAPSSRCCASSRPCTPWARVVLVTVFCEGAAVFGAFAFIPSHLHQRFGLPLSTVGAIVMGYALGGLVFALGARVLVARLGEVRLVHWGAAGMAGALVSPSSST